MLKKIVCIFVIAVMVFSFAACTATKSTDASPTAPTETEKPKFEKLEIRIADSGSENAHYAQELKKFKEYVEKETDGQVTVSLYFNGSLFGQSDQIPAIMNGNLEMCPALASKFTDYLPKLSMLEAPYLFKSYDHLKNFYASDEWKEVVEELAEKTGVRYIGGFVYGTRAVNLKADKKVTSRADLKNVKLRMMNTKSWLFLGEALGANPIPLAYSDLFLALQNGTVDGQDNPISNLKAESFNEVTKSLTFTKHVYAYQWTVISDKVWKSMSPELQKIVQDGIDAAIVNAEKEYLAEETELIPWCEENGVSVYELTDEEMASFQKEVVDYYFANGEELMKDWDMNLYQKIQDMAK